MGFLTTFTALAKIVPSFWPAFWEIRGKVDIDLFRVWNENQWRSPNGRFHGFNHQFARLREVIIDADRCHGVEGGQSLATIPDTAGRNPYYAFDEGFLQLDEASPPNYPLDLHLGKWINSITPYLSNPSDAVSRKTFTIAVTRYDPVNLFHTLADLYNASQIQL